MNNRRAFTWNVSRRKRPALEYAAQNFFHPKGESVGLGEACDFRIAVAGPQDRGELTVAIDSLVVHLNRDDTFEFLENFVQTVRQRMEMPQMQGADFFAVFARKHDRVVDWAVS